MSENKELSKKNLQDVSGGENPTTQYAGFCDKCNELKVVMVDSLGNSIPECPKCHVPMRPATIPEMKKAGLFKD